MIFNTTTPAGNAGGYEEVTLHSCTYVTDGKICYLDENGAFQEVAYTPATDMAIRVLKPSVFSVYLCSYSGDTCTMAVMGDRTPWKDAYQSWGRGYYELSTYHI